MSSDGESRFTPERKVFVKDGLVSLSLGFLMFIRVWNALLRENYYQFFAQVQRNRYDFTAVVLNTLLFATVFFVAVRIIRRHRPDWMTQWAAVVFICCLAPVVDFGRRLGSLKAPQLLDVDAWPLWIMVAGAIVIAIVFRASLSRWVYRGLVALSPAVLLALAWAGYWSVVGRTPVAADAAPHFAEMKPAERRVIWVVFDELDERVTYEARPGELTLPAFDRLRAESVAASNAYPAAGLTFLSLPSMLTGQYLEGAAVREGSGLMIRPRGASAAQPFPDDRTILQALPASGYRTAVFGWFFPYERLFPDSPTRVARSFAFPQTHGFSENTLRAAVLAQLQFSFLPPLLWHKNRELFDALHAGVLQAVRTPATDLVFAHYSVPHAPGIFDRPAWSRAQAFVNPIQEYFGNMKIADRALAELLQAVDDSGLADRTVVIVTSDHWWRASAGHYSSIDNRVPFLVRMPDRQAAVFAPRMNVIHTEALVRAVFAGAVTDTPALLTWLAARQSAQEYKYAPSGEIRLLPRAASTLP